jgi:hypothetical protein
MAEKADDQWLVRTSLNEVFGPISRDALVAQIREGKLGLQDEVCKANSYWIYLDEADEVKSLLGIEMPRNGHGPDESTETDLQGMTQELSHSANSNASQEMDSEDHGTKVMQTTRGNNRSETRPVSFDRRRYRPQMGQSKPLVLGRVERPSIWRFLVAGLIVLTGVMVAWVIRYLQTLP